MAVSGIPSEGPAEYSAFAKTLHWLVLGLLAIQFALAWSLPDIPPGEPPESIASLHMSFGIAILAVMLVRLVWRVRHRVPPLPEAIAPGLAWTARLIHFAFYLLLVALPVIGWARASPIGWRVYVFGLGPLPRLVTPGASLKSLLGWLHGNLAIVVLVLVGLHVAAALYHHFVRRDDVLRRILPMGGR